MEHFNFSKNTLMKGSAKICLVDDVNKTSTYGYTDSKLKVQYNLDVLGDKINKSEFNQLLYNSKNGLITLYSFGQYIIILQMKKDKTEMEMYFLDYKIEYSDIDIGFAGMFSENIKYEFKRIKYQIENSLVDTFDNVELNASIII